MPRLMRDQPTSPRASDQVRLERRTQRRGFTLAELIVTMVLLGIVGTIVARLMMDQQRFYQQTNESMQVRRELRSAMSMLPADLRGISSVGGDISAFNDTQLTFRSTFGAAIICARPDAFTLDLPPLDMARSTLTSWSATPGAGDTLYAFRADSMGAGGDSWTAHRIVSVAQNATLCAGSPYSDALLDAGKMRWRITVTPGIADSVKVGAAVRFTRSTRYSLISGSTNLWYLGRAEYSDGAWSAASPIAGPFRAPTSLGVGGGLRFVMIDSLGTVVPVGGDPTRISRIDLTLAGDGNRSSGAVAGKYRASDSLLFRIALRNRQ